MPGVAWLMAYCFATVARTLRSQQSPTSPFSSQARIPCEGLAGLGSAEPIAQRRPKGDLDALTASWIIGAEEAAALYPVSDDEPV